MNFNLEALKSVLPSEKKQVLNSLDLEGVAKLIRDGKVKNIISMVGAGISTCKAYISGYFYYIAAGIPDFRSPSTGIYDNLEEFGLSDPMEENPKPFFEVARRLYRPNALPTLGHYFIRLLHEKGLLKRHYTQNVDNLDRLCGLPEDKLVEAHGSFNSGHCIICKKEYSFKFMADKIIAKNIPLCIEEGCNGTVKPDIVFFGESLPRKFHRHTGPDFSSCDLLIIMGTSLTVMPFCGLIHRVGSSVPRLYINLSYGDGSTGSGFMAFLMRFYVAGFKQSSLRWGRSDNVRDVYYKSAIDEGCLQLADLLNWKII
ncbi:unnamed protein product [Protopolystoma xenopodis]|uniref:Deacetylase sirtuin-type domain-containing protein n=1 Tax=Protopolystoma xenopodis TaxID=117903 RepID=A0A448WPM3_9PLAT|nr:unnamed protein product [Protopolystoma xenopodis]